jgi:DNA polymerase-1
MSNKPVVFIFDISSHLARIFSTQTKNGFPAEGSGGFFNGEPVYCLKPLIRLIHKEMAAVNKLGIKHTHLAIVFDSFVKNFRFSLSPDYKANRPPKHKDWKRQETLMFEMFKDLGYPCFMVDGLEADDVIAALAKKLTQHLFQTVIFSGDKDIMSCCNEFVSLYAGKDKVLLTNRDVEWKFGIPPNKIIDYLSMTGDRADGVSGITGVGAKNAVTILQQHTLDDLILDPNIILGLNIRGGASIVKWITENNDSINLTRSLIKLRDDTNVGSNVNELIMKTPTNQFLPGFFQR